jgi:hypothetical protein
MAPAADNLAVEDNILKGMDFSKFRQAASRETLDMVAKALEANGHSVQVVADKAAACEAACAKLSPEKTIMLGGSGTLSEIGFTGFLKKNASASKQNFKSDSLVCMNAGDMLGAGAAVHAGKTADTHFSSIDAITEDGVVTVCCASGSRTCGFLSAGEVKIRNKLPYSD